MKALQKKKKLALDLNFIVQVAFKSIRVHYEDTELLFIKQLRSQIGNNSQPLVQCELVQLFETTSLHKINAVVEKSD